MLVDPETRLPVYLLSTSSKDPTTSTDSRSITRRTARPTSTRWAFRPRSTIDDRMPIGRLSAGPSRDGGKPLADRRLRLVVVVDPPYHASPIVWPEGDRWRIDRCESEMSVPRHNHGTKTAGWLSVGVSDCRAGNVLGSRISSAMANGL